LCKLFFAPSYKRDGVVFAIGSTITYDPNYVDNDRDDTSEPIGSSDEYFMFSSTWLQDNITCFHLHGYKIILHVSFRMHLECPKVEKLECLRRQSSQRRCEHVNRKKTSSLHGQCSLIFRGTRPIHIHMNCHLYH
jgi:hypothetical protein